MLSGAPASRGVRSRLSRPTRPGPCCSSPTSSSSRSRHEADSKRGKAVADQRLVGLVPGRVESSLGRSVPSRRAVCVIRSFPCLHRRHREVGMANHPVLGYLVWAVLIGAVFAWEGLALSHISGSVPTLSDTFRAIMRYPVGRWV